MARLKRRVAWDITTFNGLYYINHIDRFVHGDDPAFQDLAYKYGSSSHSRRFRTKKAALRFLYSDVRCPPGGEDVDGWILMKIIWTGSRVLTGEHGTLKKDR